jgi:predicted Zn-dependent protease
MRPDPKPLLLVLAVAVAAAASPLAMAAGGGGSASDSSQPAARPVDPQYAKAVAAIEAKDWAVAVALLTELVAREAGNADAFNYLGYAERSRGNLDLAFRHYERALALDPGHRGAREYLGEAYLMAGNLPKAEEQLARLDKLCFFPCNEYRELKEKIAAYRQSRQAGGKPG